MNTLYPIFMNVAEKPVLVVGGGKIAEQKVTGLVNANASVTVIAPEITENISTLAARQAITVHRRKFEKNDIAGCTLVFGATNNLDVHQEIFDESVSQNIPVNIVDVPALCTFYLASVFHEGDLKVAVSTNGKSPTLGKIIRDRIAAEFGKGYNELLETLGELRPSVHSIYKEPDRRKAVFEQIVNDEMKRRDFAGTRIEKNHKTVDAGENGKVYLVGAGPGDPDLITVKGLRVIEHADVILYDALVGSELLDKANPSCEKIFAGKRYDGHHMLQEEINALLIEKARQGALVVRLKGGDPFIFGRGGEELEALQKAGIETEAIPGITAGIGVASSVGIPLTHRGVSSNVVFVTGSKASEINDTEDWKNIASCGTIVIYMGTRNLSTIAAKLLDCGRPADTPAAVVFGGTTPEEFVIAGTLGTIAEKVDGQSQDAPGIVIVGDVVSFFKSRSLHSPEVEVPV
jgi:uroporphyrin-III C-methyltransferase/precorrin-2 dehydrogenase/sirohydrochlorin ferrochelatase